MSKNNWVILAEKICGIILIIISAIMLYYTTSSADILGTFSGMFTAIGIVILIVGILLLIITPKEEE
jgi:heme/copper-type cytochrome/quinol oxidase subunit 4